MSFCDDVKYHTVVTTLHATYFASFAVNDGNVLPTFRQPLADVDAKLSDELDAWRVVVVERKPLNTPVKPGRIVRSLGTSSNMHTIIYTRRLTATISRLIVKW